MYNTPWRCFAPGVWDRCLQGYLLLVTQRGRKFVWQIAPLGPDERALVVAKDTGRSLPEAQDAAEEATQAIAPSVN